MSESYKAALEKSKQACISDAKKYSNVFQWKRKSLRTFKVASMNGWLNECCAHMTPITDSDLVSIKLKRKQRKWTKEACVASASNFTNASAWMKANGAAYQAAHKRGWIKECCAHMKRPETQRMWTKEACVASAKQFNTKKEWKLVEGGAYSSAYKRGWIEECCSHMKKYLPKRKWTKEACIASARKFTTRSDWYRFAGAAHGAACKRGWLKECCAHMVKPQPKRKWTKELCIADARKHKNRVSWRAKSDSVYRTAIARGWLKECTSHMTKKRENWTFSECKMEAKKFKRRKEWKYKSSGSFTAARLKGWLDDCCEHMPKPTRGPKPKPRIKRPA